MTNSAEILRLRTLLCFLDANLRESGISKVARALGEPKYSVSRAVIALEKEGLIDRTDKVPVLTEKGIREAKRYAERIETTINHLMYEGVDAESAKKDALHWALYNSERSMEVFRAAEERYRVKYELRDMSHFNGAELCRRMNNGQYQFPFLLYREEIKDGTNLSMANDGFEHPCTLCVADGVGTFLFSAKSMSANSAENGTKMQGRVKNMKYLFCGNYVGAESSGKVVSIPAECLEFVNIGSGVGQILHGSVCVKMQCTVGEAHMPESTAILTVMI